LAAKDYRRTNKPEKKKWHSMDPELSRLIDLAANIAASGRWKIVDEKITHLAANPGKGDAWWVQVFACLWYQVSSEYSLLKSAYADKKRRDVALLAWRARNLLELSVWCRYCVQSRENAFRFYEDAGRDVAGIFDAFTKWGVATAQDSEWLDPIANAKQDLSSRATAVGVNSVDGPYKEVRDAAQDCGLGEHFRVSFKMLSKFAHPTAMQILGPADETQASLQMDHFFSEGCLFYTGAFEAFEGLI
jgi:hypothetical protein